MKLENFLFHKKQLTITNITLERCLENKLILINLLKNNEKLVLLITYILNFTTF